MKVGLVVVSTLLLGACSGAPVVHSSFNGYGFAGAPSPSVSSDPRLAQPRFYMDDDSTPAWLKAAPQTNR